jgi:hypothetical protein
MNDLGGETVFDIEGRDDKPVELKDVDLRTFKYGVFRKF